MNPTIFNSKTKTGVIIFAAAGLAKLWLPHLGVEVPPGVETAIGDSMEYIGAVLALFGFRDAIFKNQNAIEQEQLNENK